MGLSSQVTKRGMGRSDPHPVPATGRPDRAGRPTQGAPAPQRRDLSRRSENQAEQADDHDQSDQKDDTDGTAKELQHRDSSDRGQAARSASMSWALRIRERPTMPWLAARSISSSRLRLSNGPREVPRAGLRP